MNLLNPSEYNTEGWIMESIARYKSIIRKDNILICGNMDLTGDHNVK
jgi:hypothetical protein